MYLTVCDDRGVNHPVRDATPQEVASFGLRAYRGNSVIAAKYDELPYPMEGLRAAIAAAAA
jgi:hypothetical protein